ncbi:MAG: AsnC family transcriptional regulator [Nitrososphaerales archaeon]
MQVSNQQDKADTGLMMELWGSPERWNARKSYADVARKLGIDEQTVRNRLRRMRESGHLLGWCVFPNPTLLGRTAVSLLLEFDSSSSKEDAITRLRQVKGVASIASNYGDSLEVMVFDDGEGVPSREVEKIDALAKVQGVPSMRFPRTSQRMTPTDWQIVGLMLRNAERKVSEVAAQLKISSRSVKRRLDGMMDSSAIFVVPMVDQRRSSGVSYRLIVETRDGMRSEVDRLLSSRIENLRFKAADSGNGLIFGFSGKNVEEGNKVMRWVRQLEGVESARMTIVEEIFYVFDWLEEEVGRRALMHVHTGRRASRMGAIEARRRNETNDADSGNLETATRRPDR